MPKVLPGHVVPDITLERAKDRLSNVKGALVECPMVGFIWSGPLHLLICLAGLPH